MSLGVRRANYLQDVHTCRLSERLAAGAVGYGRSLQDEHFHYIASVDELSRGFRRSSTQPPVYCNFRLQEDRTRR